MVQNAEGKLIASKNQVTAGMPVSVTVSDGAFGAIVENIKE